MSSNPILKPPPASTLWGQEDERDLDTGEVPVIKREQVEADEAPQTETRTGALQPEREYHPTIAKLGGRKFVFGIIVVIAILLFSVFTSFRYEPLTNDVIALVDTTGKLLLGALGLFVSGNAARVLGQIFGPGRSK
jgi:hypothetical protein